MCGRLYYIDTFRADFRSCNVQVRSNESQIIVFISFVFRKWTSLRVKVMLNINNLDQSRKYAVSDRKHKREYVGSKVKV